METNRHMNCVLKVDTQSFGWEKSLTKVIKGVKDVSYSIDARHGVIRISGKINPNKLLSDIKKAGKHAVLIHAECGGRHTCCCYHENYDGYGRVEPITYPYYYYEAAANRQRLAYNFQTNPQVYNGLPAPEPEWGQAPLLPLPSAPPLDYDPHNPSCNIM